MQATRRVATWATGASQGAVFTKGSAKRRAILSARAGLLFWRDCSLEALDLAKRVVEVSEDKQAADIVLLDVRSITPVADYFVICSGRSERQLNALRRDIAQTLKREAQVTPLQTEGTATSGWVLLDYGDVVVHLFATAEREYYQLDELWSAGLPLVRIQ